MSSPAPIAPERTPERSEIDGERVLAALSPSRAGDFLACPLLYRFRSVDRLPEPWSRDAVRGTVVHRVLELLYDLPADDRDADRAAAMIEPAWEELRAAEPDVVSMFGSDEAVAADAEQAWLTSCHRVLARYFSLEDPRRLEPAGRELYVETLLESGLLLRGIVDRVDVAPDGAVRVVDYKTGRAPGEGFEAKALFQLKFYALVWWRLHGVIPAMLQIVYLGSGEVLRYSPDEQDLRATERKAHAIWQAIETARDSGAWQPRRGPLCGWCAHQALCPEWGGTPPPLPERTEESARPQQQSG
ncbi:PD-(D/E)XK nuclease family protein [Nocardioides sp. R-C-SC26]|uniref:RecB family exonuclease n=1 Tax=Nocardioides sp. R-C-SC26 TaxID=2870414 RepID=UPI001E550F9B|nr:PD-(D/E)XK nuclease family protein [Nocardioides sp. R-C-SC26]